MQGQYVVSHNGFEVGPLSPQDILAKLTKKEFQPVDYVYIEAKQDWIMLAEFQAYLDSSEPKSSQIQDQPPALSPYPQISEEKKDELLKKDPVSGEVAPLLKTTAILEDNTPPKLKPKPQPVEEEKSTEEIIRIPQKAFQVEESAKPQTPSSSQSEETATAISTATAETTSASIQLKQGEGVYSLSPEKAGQFLVQLKSTKLKTDAKLQVHVKSGKPEKISWEGPSKKTVGEEAVFHLFAEDQYGNLVTSYSGHMSVKWNGEVEASSKVQFSQGTAELRVTTTKAQKISFEILASSELPDVHLPSPAQIHFEAGSAERLILEGPDEVMAGEPVQVHVKAVDKFGNLAKLDTEVQVEVSTKTG